MKVFNIDFNKSGSSSLTKAFDILRFRTAHWLHGDERLCDIVGENKENGRLLLCGLEEYDFLSDFSGSLYFKDLDKQYPGSKFILTVRNLDSWLTSREKHVKRNLQDPYYKYDFLKIEKDKWVKEWKRMLAETKEYFKDRPEDFLIINIIAGEGWEKLCPFLGIPILDQPFPWKNKATN